MDRIPSHHEQLIAVRRVPSQAEQVKAIAMKVRAKLYREPQRESAMWASKHMPDLSAPLPGLGQQTLPATMPSIDFRLVWHTGPVTPACKSPTMLVMVLYRWG
jgi:hypothetical protein